MTRPSLRHRCRLAVFAFIFAGSASGCSTYHIYQIGGADGHEMGNQPGTEWKHKTLNSLAWGAIRQDLPVDNCRLGDGSRFGIEEIKITTNPGYLLASTVTLGFWVPLQVSWRCAKVPIPTGTVR